MKLHHINLRCHDIAKAKIKFMQMYSFREYGYLHTKDDLGGKFERILVLRHKKIFLTIQENKNESFDTIDDIAFCVDSVFKWSNQAESFGAQILQHPQKVECQQFDIKEYNRCSNCLNGFLPCLHSVEKAVIKSSIGNIKHTLLNKNNFSGEFLPGFVQTHYAETIESTSIQSLDHVALAVHCGHSEKHMAWYQKCLNLLHYKTSVIETKKGLVIKRKNGNGLRLLTLVEHPCSENSLVDSTIEEREMEGGQLKFVFCESLSYDGHDQIQTFLHNHQGEGVQHIAFSTNMIIDDARSWQEQGVRFLSPPPGYYIQIENTLKTLEEKHCESTIRQLGILIDAEKTSDSSTNNGYLYQVFTEPIFDSKTFFFELIQRDNATGFGAGNVTALWNALDLNLNKGSTLVTENHS